MPWEASRRKLPFWTVIWASIVRTMRIADACSDTMYVAILFQVVSAGECQWAGAANCAPWWRLFIAVAICTGVDWILTFLLAMFSTALLMARSTLMQWCACGACSKISSPDHLADMHTCLGTRQLLA